MATFQLSAMTGVELYITYNASTGRATSLDCDNRTAGTVMGSVTVPAGNPGAGTYGQSFAPGVTSVNFPNNVVTVVTATDMSETPPEVRTELRPVGIIVRFGPV